MTGKPREEISEKLERRDFEERDCGLRSVSSEERNYGLRPVRDGALKNEIADYNR